MHNINSLSQAADQCVMCGMCLPSCPTYQISQNEGESPRGRISLIKAFNEKKLTSSAAMQAHIQSCTGCMKCEQICPANVPYQQIIDAGRQIYKGKLSLVTRFLQAMSMQLLTTKLGHHLILIMQKLSGLLSRQMHIANVLQSNPIKKFPLNNTSGLKKTITIFPGCTGSLFDQETLSSITHLCAAIGYKTNIPNKIMCCGALAQHSGSPERALQESKNLQAYLEDQKIYEYISFASGCGHQLTQQLSNAVQHYDVVHWLNKVGDINSLKFAPLAKRVLLHIPCTYEQIHIDSLYQTLALVPTIQISTFEDNLFCCGAGGAQLLMPEDSNLSLLNSKIKTIHKIQPDIVLSSNIGCSMHLQTGLKKAGLDIEVIHPVTLLARQLIH